MNTSTCATGNSEGSANGEIHNMMISPCLSEVVSQQETVMHLESALTEQRSELQRLAEQIEASQANELAEESPTAFWVGLQFKSFGQVYYIKLIKCIKNLTKPVYARCM